MDVNDADVAWTGHLAARKKVADLNGGRETALAHVRKMPGHDAPTETAFRGGAYFLPMVSRTREAFGGLVDGEHHGVLLGVLWVAWRCCRWPRGSVDPTPRRDRQPPEIYCLVAVVAV